MTGVSMSISFYPRLAFLEAFECKANRRNKQNFGPTQIKGYWSVIRTPRLEDPDADIEHNLDEK